jgi:hypothetical protein
MVASVTSSEDTTRHAHGSKPAEHMFCDWSQNRPQRKGRGDGGVIAAQRFGELRFTLAGLVKGPARSVENYGRSTRQGSRLLTRTRGFRPGHEKGFEDSSDVNTQHGDLN